MNAIYESADVVIVAWILEEAGRKRQYRSNECDGMILEHVA